MDVTVAWDANSESDLAGYILCYGTSSESYTEDIDVGNKTQYKIKDLVAGTIYYFAAKAYDTSGNESDFSKELVYQVPAADTAPDRPYKPNGPLQGQTLTNYTYNTTATNPDYDSLEYKFDWGDGSISGWGTASQSHSWSAAGNYCIRARARDEEGTLSDWSNCRNITITLIEYTISASAGANGSISPSGSVTVNHGSDKTFTINAEPNHQVLAVWIDGNSQGAIASYTFKNVTKSHTISASFVSSNPKPNANAGSDQTVTNGTTVSLNGKNSTDPGGSIVSYSWRQIDGPSVPLSNANSKEATFTAPDVGIAGETLTFRLTVTDDGGLTDTDRCSIEVTKDVVVDSDGDGVPDDQDDFPFDPDEYLDTDGDGEGDNADTDDDNDAMPDEWELAYGLDPLRNDAAEDPDGDEVSNIDEFNLGTEPNYHEANSKPLKPILLTPENEMTVGLTPELAADDFMDPDINDSHGKTRWVIYRAFDDVCVFDITSDTSLKSIILPKQILEENTEYIWQIRYFDNHHTPSDWSETHTFITAFDDTDANGDGIPDIQEVAETLDLDENGIPDKDQNDIKCIQVEGRSTQIGIGIHKAETIQAITALESHALEESSNAARYFVQGMDWPYGLINFRLVVSHPGDEVTVTLYLSEAVSPDGTWYKYDPVNDVWYDCAAYAEFSDNRKRIYLTLMDGGFGDADGIANGIIVDPLALSVPSPPSAAAADNPVSSDSENSGGGGGGGCFITASGQDLPADGHQTGRGQTILAVILMMAVILLATGRRLADSR